VWTARHKGTKPGMPEDTIATARQAMLVRDSKHASLRDVYRLMSRRYPAFVYTGELGDYLPVFTFHTLDATEFEAKLRFLAENGYSTLNLDDALRHFRGRGDKPRRSVVLTIDDGRLSTWSVGYPLLRQYGMCATAYVIPGYLEDGPPRPLFDEHLGDAPDAVERVDRSTFMRWSEVESLQASGVIRIESHTMLHRRVPVSERLLGFLGPDPDGPVYDWPKDPTDRVPWTRERLRENPGLPLFEHLPVLAASRSWQGYRTVADLCRSLAGDAGDGFMSRPGWERRLRTELRRRKPWPGGMVDLADEQGWELSESKRCLEDRLPGKRVRHFCFPHSLGNRRSLRFALDAGYSTTAWGLLPGAGRNRRGSGGEVVERLKHDFLFRLPGAGRKSLRTILSEKFFRRLRGDRGF
jgi:hypothetical protein